MRRLEGNRAQRRALQRRKKQDKPVIGSGGAIGVKSRFMVLDRDGNDVTAERVRLKHDY